MDPNVKKLFDSGADDYDWQRRQLIPCFDDFYGMAVSLVEPDERSPRVLDLGAVPDCSPASSFKSILKPS